MQELKEARDRTRDRLISELEKPHIKALLENIEAHASRNRPLRKQEGELAKIRLLKHITKTVPFYRNWPQSVQIEPLQLEKFPILERSTLASNLGVLISRDQITGEILASDLYLSSTSGSTGHPVTHIKSSESNGFAELVFWQRLQAAFAIPKTNEWLDLGLRVFGQPLVQGRVLPSATIAWNMRTYRRERPEFMQEYESILRAAEPDVIWGTPSRVHELAKVVDELGILVRPNVVLTSYEPLTDSLRELLLSQFKCPVASVYGTSELGLCAWQCSKGAFHFDEDLFVLEVVDEQGEVVNDGDCGRIVITSLHSTCVPLVRYDTGDLGAARRDICECGREDPRLVRIEGRRLAMVITREGVEFSPYRLIDYIGSMGVHDFQIQQTYPGSLRIALGKQERPLTSDRKSQFIALASSFLGESTHVEFSHEHPFVLANSGKKNPFVRITDGAEKF
ncbi:phenylacetate--CoA ligase family protein [Pseudomonas sp. MN1F]|uniref:phenylacetate--CoA ligase family protein n=1 Tax=Pseudomonas sp. MN1F TaxID=1366632 RepID=UPI00128EF970|nr:phenylacetate--CoA ligase family protein [Pseudomonas sp. MN1F]MQG92026.1 phenylacetate--CoA ligase family protein [Pseudomonas sp. MN1F]